MESKKTKKSNLESKRTYFLQIGFVVALALTLIAFEWSTPVNSPSFEYYGADDDVPEEIIPITINQPAPPPPPIIAPDILIISDDFPNLKRPSSL
jgi:periplasmic protein TonB